MASIERTAQGRWRARYRDPAGRTRSRTFRTKADARRFLDTSGADMHRAAGSTPQVGGMTPRRVGEAPSWPRTADDLDEHTERPTPRPRAATCSRASAALPLAADPERSTSGPGWPTSSGPDSPPARSTATTEPCAAAATSRSRHELLARSPRSAVKAPAIPTPGDAVPHCRRGPSAAPRRSAPHYRPLVYTAAYTGMRWGELIGLRRANVDLDRSAITVVEQLMNLDRRCDPQAPKTKAGRRAISDPGVPRRTARTSSSTNDQTNGPDGLVFPNRDRQPDPPVELQLQPLEAGQGCRRTRGPSLPRPSPYRVALAIAQGAHPEVDPSAHGPQQRAGDARPLRPPVPRARQRIADGLDDVFRASLTLIEGGLRDTRRTQRTRKGHKIRDYQRSIRGHWRTHAECVPLTRTFRWRRRPESNRCTGLCRPLPKPLGHAATAPWGGGEPTGRAAAPHPPSWTQPAGYERLVSQSLRHGGPWRARVGWHHVP